MRRHTALHATDARCGARTHWRFALVVVLSMGAGAVAHAQSSPAHGPLTAVPPGVADREQELADYLALLQRIAPAARVGALQYVAAMQLRCGRRLSAAELREAMAREGGDPTLMGLIRAEATQDRAARHRLMAQVVCAPQERP